MMPHRIELLALWATCRGNGFTYYQPRFGRTWVALPLWDAK